MGVSASHPTGRSGVHRRRTAIDIVQESAVEAALPAPPQAVPRFTTERVLAVRRWTSTLLSVRTSRSPDFRFTPGHYTRLGLGDDDADVVWRPFSVVSAAGVTLDPEHTRIMVCGNPELGRALRRQLTQRNFHVNRRAAPGQLAFENYWQATGA
jgi:NAD(P)H-flavin reductase